MANVRRFLAELKRRNVLRAGALYVAGVWALGQGLSQFSPALGLPDWTTRWFLIATAVGFPFWLAFAWFYEFTPKGFKRDNEIAQDAPMRHSNARLLEFAIIGVLAVAVVLLVTNTLVWHKGAGLQAAASAAIPAKSIAVLPFENLSNDKNNEYFVAGMQDMILTKLADIGELKVISRTSTTKYASHPDDLKTIAQQLGVATILEGSVQKVGKQVLINVQLIDAHSDSHIWAQSYQRTLDNVFGVEGKVAEMIAQALKAKLSPAETRRLATALSPDPAANDLFLRAEYLANKGNINYDTASMKAAIALYQKAVTANPKFALALARLSYMQSHLAFLGGGGIAAPALVASARANAERALALQPDSADAHLAMGYSDYYGRSDYPAALKAFAAVLQARPNDADAMAATAFVLRRQGHFDAAIAQLQAALERDPRNTIIAFNLGVTDLTVRRYADAEQGFQRALALDPNNINAKLLYSYAIVFDSGNVERALAQVQGNDPQLKGQRVLLFYLQRNYHAAIELLDSIADTPDNFAYRGGPKAMQLGNLYRLAGDTARARPLFEQALPQVRAELGAEAGSAIELSFVWGNIANVELGLGQTKAALAAIAKSQALVTQSGDHVNGPQNTLANAMLYAEAGRAGLAVPLLEQFFAAPGSGLDYAPLLLWIDPAWDPIHHDPRFQALLKKYAKYKPATAGVAAPASTAAGAD